MSHMGGCYSKLHKKDGQPTRSLDRSKAKATSSPPKKEITSSSSVSGLSASTAVARRLAGTPEDKVNSESRPKSSPSSVVLGSTSSPLRRTKPGGSSSPVVPSPSAQRRTKPGDSSSPIVPSPSSQRRTKPGGSSSPSAPSSSSTVVPTRPRRSPSASSLSSNNSTPRPASKIRPPSTQASTRTSSRPHRSRSGNREHPYSRQTKSEADENAKDMTAQHAVRELHQMAETDTYRAFKVQKRRYIAAPRSCDDNYNAENYTKRLSSETATSSESDRTLISTTSIEEGKETTNRPSKVSPCSPITPDSAIASQATFPTPVTEAGLSASESVDESVASTMSGYCSAAPSNVETNARSRPPSPAVESSALTPHSTIEAPTSSTKNSSLLANTSCASLNTESCASTTNDSTTSLVNESTSSLTNDSVASLTQSTSSLTIRRSTCDLSRPTEARNAALSVSSLNSDDLMLTTDVGLDLEDDDIIKDIDDTEKEDPFVVANALATAPRNDGGNGKGSRKNNLPTPETISSAMSLVQHASKTVAAASGIPSPKVGIIRKKSTPATPSGDSAAKASVLRRIRAQSNIERPRSFSSPLRPPSRQRGQTTTDADEAPVLMPQADFRHVSHDMRSVKLLLLRLKGMLLEDEGHQPIFAEQMSNSFYGQSNLSMSSSSIKQRSDSNSEPTTPLTGPDPFSPAGEEQIVDLETATREALIQEVLSLRRTTTLLRTKLAEKETTVKLLQQQMTKNIYAGGPAESPSALDSLRSFGRHHFPGKPLSFDSAGGTEPSSPVVVDPVCSLAASVINEASSSAASLPNGDAIGLSPRPSIGPRLKSTGGRRERAGGGASASRPSFLPVNISQQGKRSISTGHIPHRKTTPLTSTNSQH